MAETPVAELHFLKTGDASCRGCAERRIAIPGPLPDPGDDFDWRARDFDGFRRVMLEELAARFPERTRWTAADLEVVLVEALAAMLDQLSDMADRVFAEAYLETARRPDSVRRLLSMIGYDAAAEADSLDQIAIDAGTSREEANQALEQFWARNPHAIEAARRAGPRAIRTQHRMVAVEDYAERLEDHPLVLRAHASTKWTGAWHTIELAAILWGTGLTLDQPVPRPQGDPGSSEFVRRERLLKEIAAFNERRRISVPDWSLDPTARTVLRPYVDLYRMTGQEVVLQDAVPIGIAIVISVVVSRNYFRSEVRAAVAAALGIGPDGFFAPGRLRFGEDLFASDVIAAVMALDGVDNACLIRFKRAGDAFPDESASGRIRLEGLEMAVCDNDPLKPERGYQTIRIAGGMSG
ncbi:MAG: hypothetical protein GY788_27985 [bacterium]|nr:hypothetical protein [bacterium]